MDDPTPLGICVSLRSMPKDWGKFNPTSRALKLPMRLESTYWCDIGEEHTYNMMPHTFVLMYSDADRLSERAEKSEDPLPDLVRPYYQTSLDLGRDQACLFAFPDGYRTFDVPNLHGKSGTPLRFVRTVLKASFYWKAAWCVKPIN